MNSILESRRGKIALFTLNSEASLNALTLEMIEQLTPRLLAAEQDPNVAAVWLEGAGSKAFCAGGDIRRLREAVLNKDFAWTDYFFCREYQLDYWIHVYKKPLIAWGQGIVMGGGLGLYAGASHRLVTETTQLAMPEISIGLYPDVGASSFLRRLPFGAALFLALTGTRLQASDGLFSGLANAFVPNSSKESLLRDLEQTSFATGTHSSHNKSLINTVLRRHEVPSTTPYELPRRLLVLEEAAQAATLPEYIKKLEQAAAQDSWIQRSVEGLRKGSPTSAAVIFELMHRTRGWKLEEGFALDLTLTCQFARHPDLPEGIRALLIDKDKNPRWNPQELSAVSPDLVETHFRWPGSQPHPFGLSGEHLFAQVRGLLQKAPES